MAYYGRRSSIFDSFTLSPLPYPVLLVLAVTLIFPALYFYFSYDQEAVGAAGDKLSWLLFAIPVLAFIFLVRWLSSWNRSHNLPSEGSSPWGVAAIIVLLLTLVHYQSGFLESWSIF